MSAVGGAGTGRRSLAGGAGTGRRNPAGGVGMGGGAWPGVRGWEEEPGQGCGDESRSLAGGAGLGGTRPGVRGQEGMDPRATSPAGGTGCWVELVCG